MLLWLGLATLLAIVLSSLLLHAFNVELSGSEDASWLEDFWQSTLRTLDAGTMANDIGWGRRVLALLVTLFGILIAGTLIGIIAAGVEQRIEAMQRGRSGVVETDHVVILGASGHLAVLIEQLALAGRTRRRNVIVVLADRMPTELSHEVRSATPDLYGTKLVFRWGDPSNVDDLEMVALRSARSVLVLADDEVGDSDVVKAVLAVGVALGDEIAIPIVAEVGDPAVGQSLVRACGPHVHPITPDQAIARLATYAFRGPHLIRVIQQLLDFHGPDLYVRDPGALAGRTFADSVFAFEDARSIGIIDPSGAVELCPPPATVLDPQHRLVLIAEDDTPPTPSRHDVSSKTPSLSAIRPVVEDLQPQHVLIVGWSVLAEQLVTQLDESVSSGSTVTIVYDTRFVATEPDLSGVTHLDVTVTATSTPLLYLEEHHADPHRLTSVLFVGYRHEMSAAEADSRTLLNLRVVRRELADRGLTPSVLIELRDAANVDLAAPVGLDDLVVSDAMASSMLAQLAEQPERRAVLLRLYGETRPGIGTIDAELLGLAGTVEFREIVRRAYEHGLVAIGWMSVRSQGDEVRINPMASERVDLGGGGTIVVIG